MLGENKIVKNYKSKECERKFTENLSFHTYVLYFYF